MKNKGKLLFVNSCPRSEASRTLMLAKKFLEQTAENCDITEIDIMKAAAAGYSCEPYGEFPQLRPHERTDLEMIENAEESGDYSDGMFNYAKQFAAADRIVVAAPFWDLSFPSILRIYYEAVSVCGITFRYEGADSVGMCRAAKAAYISTCGGYAGEFHHGEEYTKVLLGMMGIDDLQTVRAEGLDIAGADPAAAVEKAVCEMIKEAKNF